ncbi:MAG: hypothetical protein LBD37_08085 [Treponema sp.]|jgi:hypothetical protein|nr:hypothetical protein [Treponema sp.]
MKKILGFLSLFLVLAGFVTAQTVTKEKCTIEYDSAKKVVRLTNGNDDVFTVQYTIDGKGKSVNMDKKAVWELDASKAAPKAVDIVKANKSTTPPTDLAKEKEWKAVAAAAAKPAAAPAASPAAAPAPAAGGKASGKK